MPPGDDRKSSEEDFSPSDGQDDRPASNLPPQASAEATCCQQPKPAQSTKMSRVQSVLHHLFRRGKQRKKDPSASEQECQEEKVEDTSRVSPRHHQIPGMPQVMPSAKKPSSRLQSVLQKVSRKKRHCGTDVPQDSDQLTVEPREQGDEPSRLPMTKESPQCSQPDSVGTASEKKLEMAKSEPRNAVSLVSPDSFGLLQHVQVTSKNVCRVENVNVSGDENPCFFGPMYEPTFNVTVVSPPKDQGPDKQGTLPPYSLEAALQNQHIPPEDPRRQDGQKPEVMSSSGKSNAPPAPDGECSKATKMQEAALAEAAADQCEAALQSCYTSTGSYVQMIPWVDDDTKHIMDIYTNLQLVGVGKEGKLKSYDGIFRVETREGNVIKRIILNGLAGVGKSTLIDKVTYDWAMKCVGVLQKFKLVFALKMHSLEQSSDLIDAVFAQLLDQDTPIDRHALKSYINANPEKVLILLDGFDEFMTTNLNEDAFGSILKILNRKECRDCSVVVSTRSSHFNKLRNKLLVQKPFTHVKVLGFSSENVEEYTRKFYLEDPEQAQLLLERIRSSDVLLDLARSPMLLLLMCVLWREESCLPETMFRLYSEALRYIFKRKGDISSNEVSRVVIEIGRIAFHGLISPVQVLSFDEGEFEPCVLSMAIRVGLVTSQRVLKGLIIQNSIQFMHMTFLEFCAAQYFQSLLTTDPKEFQKVLEQLERTIKNHPAGFECLLRFCSGDNETCASHVVKMLRCSASDPALKLALMCFFESQSKSLPSQDLVNEVMTNAVCIEDCNSDSVNSYMWFMKHIVDQSMGKTNANLANVEELAICRCNLQRWDTALTYCIQGLTRLSILVLKACSLTAGNMQHIASSLSSTANLTVLDLSGNESLGGSLPSWAPHLQALKKLEILKLEDCHLNRRDVRCLAVSVGHIGKLQDCTVQTDVYCHCPKDDLVWPTNPLVSRTNEETSGSCGVRLDMIEYSLTGTDLADILEAMTTRSDVAELILSRNQELSGSAALWFSPLKYLKCLEKLVLCECSLRVTDIEHIAVSVSEMPSVVKLDLSWNNLGGLGAFWAPHMQVMKHLKKLNLRYCSLTGDDAKLLAVSLSSLANFVKLDLSCNESLGGSAGMWASHIDQMRSLQKLCLRQCALTSKDVKHIAGPLSNMANFKEWNLSSNEQLSNCAVTWSPHVRSIQHLKSLVLLGCNLNKQDLKHVAASFGEMPSLVNCVVKSPYLSGRFLVQPTDTGIRLDLSQRSLTGKDLASILGAVRKRNDLVEFILSGNDSLSGSAKLWTPYLKQLKHLEGLELHHCSLQGGDMEHIATMLKDMTSLIKLDLSLNDTLGGLCKLWSPNLKQMKHLQTLDLSSCALTGDDIKHIACDMPNLIELKLSHNSPLGGSASSWAPSVQLLSCLETLDLDDCNIKRQEFKYIAASIGQMGKLTSCSVRSNYMGSRFQCLIRPINTGIQVYLSERSLTGTDLADILEGLSARDDLVELSLVGNNTLRSSAVLWAPQLKQLKNLAVLVLNRCSLLGSDIGHIALSLSSMPALRVLELSGNTALGGVCATWAQHLCHLQHIQKLHLGSCSLLRDDIEHIAEMCSTMPELSTLDLSGNGALSNCATLWAPFLEQLQQLCELNFEECALTGEDRQHVSMHLSLNDFTHCFF